MLNRSEVRRRAEHQRIVDSRIGRYIRGEISATCLVNCPWRKSYKKPHKFNAVDYDVMHRSRQHVGADKIRYKVRPPFRNAINAKNTSFVSVVEDLKRMKLDDSKCSSKNSLKPATKNAKGNLKEDKPPYANLPRKLENLAVANEKVNDTFKRVRSFHTNLSDKICGAGSSMVKIRNNSKKTSTTESTAVDHDNSEFVVQTPHPCSCLADPDVDSFCICQNEMLKRIIPETGIYLKEIKKKLNHLRDRSSRNKSVVSPVLSFYSSNNEETANFEYLQCN